LRPQEAPLPAKRLNPSFQIENEAVVMVTQFLSSVPRSDLQTYAGNLSDHHQEIVDAVDFVLQGF
jgi:toxin CcdB